MLVHPAGFRIIGIAEREQEVPVHALIETTGLPQAMVSQHLNQVRRGKKPWHSITGARAASILNGHCSDGDFA